MTQEQAQEAVQTAAKDLRYYERALDLQAKKIEEQRLMSARLNRVYSRDACSTKISEAFGFLLKVIIKKIKK